MRTEKIGLNSYLHRIKRADDTFCPCGDGYHTVNHILRECRLFWRQRKAVLGTGFLRNPFTLISTQKLVQKAANFIIATGILGQFSYYRDLQSELVEG